MDKIYDTLIIGTGPAGLCASIYGERAMLNVLALEENYVSGGQMATTYEVDNYPGMPGISGMDLGMAMREHAEKMGVQIHRGKVRSIERKGDLWSVHTKKESFLTRTITAAMGARHRLLGVPGEGTADRYGRFVLRHLRRGFFPGQDGGCSGRRRCGGRGRYFSCPGMPEGISDPQKRQSQGCGCTAGAG